MRPKTTVDPWVPRPTFKRRDLHPRITPLRENYGRVIWSIDDQGWAVGHGLFVARAVDHGNRVILVALPNNTLGWSTDNPTQIISWLYSRAFNLDFMADKLLVFIRQQDEYGCYDAWDAIVDKRDLHLLWYKVWFAEKRNKRHQAAPFYHALYLRERDRVKRITAKARETRLQNLEAKRREAIQAPRSPVVQAILDRALQRQQAEAEGRRTPAQKRQDEQAEAQMRLRELQRRDTARRYAAKRREAVRRLSATHTHT